MNTSTTFNPASSISSSGTASQEVAPAPNTKSDSLESSSTFYLTSVHDGYVLAHQENGDPSGVVAMNKGERDGEQKWTIERSDEPNIMAFRNVASGKYLHCFEAQRWGKVGTGDKQWWRVSNDNVTAPGAFELSPIDSPKWFLNFYQVDVSKGSAAKTRMMEWQVSADVAFCHGLLLTCES
jgi:hypothetical protein